MQSQTVHETVSHWRAVVHKQVAEAEEHIAVEQEGDRTIVVAEEAAEEGVRVGYTRWIVGVVGQVQELESAHMAAAEVGQGTGQVEDHHTTVGQ